MNKSDKNTLVNNIAEQRKQHGETQTELADALNISLRTLWNWEHGQPMPLDKAFEIAEVLDCSLSDLFPESQPTN